MKYDLGIIGGGPAGYVAAAKAANKGMKVVMFEKKDLGGVCLNEGCIPTKALLYSAKVYDYALHAKKYGVSVENAGFDFGKMMDRKTKIIRKLVAGVSLKMTHHQVTVVKGEALIEKGDALEVAITCNGESYECARVLLCTGSQSFIPPIPGLREAGEAVVTNRELLTLKEQPQSLVVIGGGVIGMEFASFFNSIGTHVTIVEMLPEILGGLDGEVSAMLRDIYTKKGITFNLSCKVTKVEGNEVTFLTPQGTEEKVSGDKILVSVGRRPVISGYGLENIGVVTERGGVKVDCHMRTNLPNVYAAGDITGFSLLAHTASREGEVAVNNMAGEEDIMSYAAIPGIVYTNPEVAGIGLTEEQAKAQGTAYRVAKLPMAYSGRFVAENEGGNGLCKIITDEKGERILGAHMLGNPCSEIIWGIGIAIEKGLTVNEMLKMVFPHPTVCEILRETMEGGFVNVD